MDTRVLVVDDHLEMARVLAEQLADVGYAVDVAGSGTEAISLAEERRPDLVIADLRMEGVDGFGVLRGVHRVDPSVPVLIMTAFGAVDSAIEAIKRGAYHYFTKPFKLLDVLAHVEDALGQRRARHAAGAFPAAFGIVGRSAPMQALRDLVGRVAAADAPVLIRGESGAGKELVGRALHELSARAGRPYVAVNCAALPESLLESELFGHVRGAFTGATAPRHGLFVEADGGTLLLDEIGDMPLPLQAKLLRVLEDGLVRPVGSDSGRPVSVRVLASTHRDVDDLVFRGAFRADLFYRLNVVPIEVPPLRRRLDDLDELVAHVLGRARAQTPHSPVRRVSSEALAALARHSWPGNVRELENLVRRLVIVGRQEVVGLDQLAAIAPGMDSPQRASPQPPLVEARSEILPLRRVEDDYIAWVVEQCGGNKRRAADALGIDVSTIHRRVRSRR